MQESGLTGPCCIKSLQRAQILTRSVAAKARQYLYQAVLSDADHASGCLLLQPSLTEDVTGNLPSCPESFSVGRGQHASIDSLITADSHDIHLTEKRHE